MRLVLRLTAILSVSFFSACSTASQANSLSEGTEATYETKVAGYVAEAKARPNANPSGASVPLRDHVILAPVVFHWAAEFVGDRGFPPYWVSGDNSRAIQKMTNDVATDVVKGLEAKGLKTLDAARYKSEIAGLDRWGDSPTRTNGRLYNGSYATDYPYVSWKMKQWSRNEFANFKAKVPASSSVVFVEIFSTWSYEGHTRMNGEAVVNYKVGMSPKIQVCTGNVCKVSYIAIENPVNVILRVPANKAVNESAQEKNNVWMVGYGTKVLSQTVSTMIDNITVVQK